MSITSFTLLKHFWQYPARLASVTVLLAAIVSETHGLMLCILSAKRALEWLKMMGQAFPPHVEERVKYVQHV